MPPYVNIQYKYVNMRHTFVNMQNELLKCIRVINRTTTITFFMIGGEWRY